MVTVPLLKPVVEPPLNCTSTSVNFPAATFCAPVLDSTENGPDATIDEIASVDVPVLRTRIFACVCAAVLGNAGSPTWNLLNTSRSGAGQPSRFSVPISGPAAALVTL